MSRLRSVELRRGKQVSGMKKTGTLNWLHAPTFKISIAYMNFSKILHLGKVYELAHHRNLSQDFELQITFGDPEKWKTGLTNRIYYDIGCHPIVQF